MQYSKKLLSYFHNVQHVGQLDLSSPNVTMAEVGRFEQGSVLHLYLQTEAQEIIAAKFLAQGSVAIVACCEFVCEWLEGKSIDESLQLSSQQIMEVLEISSLQSHVAIQVECLVKKAVSAIMNE